MKITDVYQFYQDNVKPIYSEIEARDNNIPVELLFETYATFDHIKRYYLNGESEETASQKAISHLKRGVLDAFKLKLKYLNKDIEILLNTKVDLQLIDNGQFISSLYKDRQEIITLAKKARLTEGKQSKEEAFQCWNEVSILIDDFEKKYFTQIHKIDWAKNRTFEWINKDSIRGLIVGILSSLLVGAMLWAHHITQHR